VSDTFESNCSIGIFHNPDALVDGRACTTPRDARQEASKSPWLYGEPIEPHKASANPQVLGGQGARDGELDVRRDVSTGIVNQR